jgi:phosphoribosylglycinamide formyltransferase-1
VHGQAERSLGRFRLTDAYALQRAAKCGIPHCVIDYAAFENKADFFAQLKRTLLELNPAVIVLAGFMKICSGLLRGISEQDNQHHPALIPSFCERDITA